MDTWHANLPQQLRKHRQRTQTRPVATLSTAPSLTKQKAGAAPLALPGPPLQLPSLFKLNILDSLNAHQLVSIQALLGTIPSPADCSSACLGNYPRKEMIPRAWFLDGPSLEDCTVIRELLGPLHTEIL